MFEIFFPQQEGEELCKLQFFPNEDTTLIIYVVGEENFGELTVETYELVQKLQEQR